MTADTLNVIEMAYNFEESLREERAEYAKNILKSDFSVC